MYNNQCVNGTKNEGRRKNKADEAYSLPGDSSIYMQDAKFRSPRSSPQFRNHFSPFPPLLLLLLLHTLSTNQHSFPAAIHPSIHLPAHTNPNTTPQTKSKPPPPPAPATQAAIYNIPYSILPFLLSYEYHLSPNVSRSSHPRGKGRPCRRRCVFSAKKPYNQRINLPTNLVLLIRSPVFHVSPRG